MSFISEFKTIIESDPSILSYVPVSRIKMGHLPEDFELNSIWLAWDYKLESQTDSLCKNNCYSTYVISITVTTNDTLDLNNLSELVIKYLNNKTTDNFPDITLRGDSKLTTLIKPKNIYQNTLEFVAIYLGSPRI